VRKSLVWGAASGRKDFSNLPTGGVSSVRKEDYQSREDLPLITVARNSKKLECWSSGKFSRSTGWGKRCNWTLDKVAGRKKEASCFSKKRIAGGRSLLHENASPGGSTSRRRKDLLEREKRPPRPVPERILFVRLFGRRGPAGRGPATNPKTSVTKETYQGGEDSLFNKRRLEPRRNTILEGQVSSERGEKGESHDFFWKGTQRSCSPSSGKNDRK